MWCHCCQFIHFKGRGFISLFKWDVQIKLWTSKDTGWSEQGVTLNTPFGKTDLQPSWQQFGIHKNMATGVGPSGALWTGACFLHFFALKLISACFHVACNSLFYLLSCFQERKSTLRPNLNLGTHFWLQRLNAGLIQSMCQVDTNLVLLQ